MRAHNALTKLPPGTVQPPVRAAGLLPASGFGGCGCYKRKTGHCPRFGSRLTVHCGQRPMFHAGLKRPGLLQFVHRPARPGSLEMEIWLDRAACPYVRITPVCPMPSRDSLLPPPLRMHLSPRTRSRCSHLAICPPRAAFCQHGGCSGVSSRLFSSSIAYMPEQVPESMTAASPSIAEREQASARGQRTPPHCRGRAAVAQTASLVTSARRPCISK